MMQTYFVHFPCHCVESNTVVLDDFSRYYCLIFGPVPFVFISEYVINFSLVKFSSRFSVALVSTSVYTLKHFNLEWHQFILRFYGSWVMMKQQRTLATVLK